MTTRRDSDFATFCVAGRAEFPMDMLRHDQCWPAYSDDAARLYGDATADRRTVRLQTWNRTSPNVRRWASFGWVVVDTGREYGA
jgi:hypothetical protein